MSDVVRTVERGYYTGSRRAGQVRRVHVIRDVPPRRDRMLPAGSETWCGQHATRHHNSAPIVRDAPHELPDGLSWCPTCVGKAAEQLGRLHAVARLLGLERAE